MKRTFALLFAALLTATLCTGCVKTRRIRLPKEPAVYEIGSAGVSVQLERCTVEINRRYPKQKPLFSLRTAFTNIGTAGVMRIKFDCVCYDAKGIELDTIHLSQTMVNVPLAPGGVMQDEHAFRHESGASVSSVSLAVTEVLTTEEMPPVRLPAEGDAFFAAFDDANAHALYENRLTDPPISATVRIDNQEYPEATIDDPALIGALIDAMAEITIGKETDSFVTDRYHAVQFDLTNGESVGFSFNDRNLEYRVYGKTYLYELENDNAFWKLANDIVENAAEDE